MTRLAINTILVGDCRKAMAALSSNSVDAIVTDPPYELGFMGKGWDAAGVAFDPATWRAALRVLKPGGHLVAFGGTRTYHRLACAIEDAGFEIRDCLMWLYGTGFPKSLDVSKAIDKAAGTERPVLGIAKGAGSQRTEALGPYAPEYVQTASGSADAQRWEGWGTALKPSCEPIVLARKSFAKGATVASNVVAFGTGALNVKRCEIETVVPRPLIISYSESSVTALGDGLNGSRAAGETLEGRWPANIILDEEAAAMLDAQSGDHSSGSRAAGVRTGLGYHGADGDGSPAILASTGGASRFFYCAKAGTAERSRGLDSRNPHPTVKPLSLMRWLVTLVTPPGGLVLDPFVGSGSTAIAARMAGFQWIGCELWPRYAAIAQQRIGEPCRTIKVRTLS